MRIRIATRLLNSFALVVLVVTNILMLSTLFIQDEYSKKQESRFESYRLAEELRHSSRDLTTAVRAFVATGDVKYREEFQEILDQRNGVRSRPDGRTISLRELMEAAHFSDAELEMLSVAEARSNALAKIEMQAMNAVVGIFPDANGNYVLKKNPNRELGIQLVYDFKYRKSVEGIMDPIKRFEDMVVQRTESDAIKYQFLLRSFLISVFCLIFIYTFSVFLSTYLQKEDSK